ncbi:MAG: LysM peptidoglycan-binding domain-containing M23 family metallopeptidase [Candidatus Berkelbacteria bacterium]
MSIQKEDLLLPDSIRSIYKRIFFKIEILIKKIRNRTPDKLKELFTKFILPYSSILIITAFVFISNYVQSIESSTEYVPSAEVMDLDPYTVAKTVNAINPYTPMIEGDSVGVILAMKDEEYLGKPVIIETQTTAADISGNRKGSIAYIVKPGDTISSIGWEYGLKIATIKNENGLTSDNIKLGQKLMLPPQDVSANTLATLKKVSNTVKTAFKGTFGRPVRGWDMSQVFGHTNFEKYHTGIDLTSRSGTTILASASGTVTLYRGWGGGYGNHIVINHGNGYSTLYGHMSAFTVSNGQYVNQGQQIGIMGSTGWSTGTHLHFEIRKNNSPQNPLNYL